MKNVHVPLRTWFVAGGLLVIITVIPLIGCSELRDRRSSPTEPEENSEAAPKPVLDIESVASFYANRPDSETVGVYSALEELVMRTPAGDYLLAYETSPGMNVATFRATKAAMVYIGLLSGQQAINAWLVPGTISSIPADAQESNMVTLCTWPGSSTSYTEIFSK